MTKFEVIAYETENGDNPAIEFLNGLDTKMRAKVGSDTAEGKKGSAPWLVYCPQG